MIPTETPVCGGRERGALPGQPCSYDEYVVTRHLRRRTLFDKRGVKSDVFAWNRVSATASEAIRKNRVMDLGELPEGWVSWEVEPIEPGSRRTADERLVGRGGFVRRVISNRVLDLPAGAPPRRRAFTSGVRGAFALLNRLELDGCMRAYADDCHYFYEDGAALGIDREGTGREAIKRFLGQFDDVFGQRIFYPTLLIDAGGPTLVGRVEAVAQGHVSGAEVGLVTWNAWTFDRGSITEQYMSADRERVLARLPR